MPRPEKQERDSERRRRPWSGPPAVEVLELIDAGLNYREIAEKYGMSLPSTMRRCQTLVRKREEMAALVKARNIAARAAEGEVDADSIKSVGDEVRVSFNRVRAASDFNNRMKERLEDYLFGEEGSAEHEDAREFLDRYFAGGTWNLPVLYKTLQDYSARVGQFGVEVGKSLQYAFRIQKMQNDLFSAMDEIAPELRDAFFKKLINSDALMTLFGQDMLSKLNLKHRHPRKYEIGTAPFDITPDKGGEE